MHPLLIIPTETVLIVVVIAALILFGGSRLSGLGKGAGKAIREFKEETDGLHRKDAANAAEQITAQPAQPTVQQPVVQQPVQQAQPVAQQAQHQTQEVYQAEPRPAQRPDTEV